MMPRFLAFVSILCLALAQPALPQETPAPTPPSGTTTGAPAATGPAATTATTPTTQTPVATAATGATAPTVTQPHVDSISPAAPVIQPNEPLTLIGSGFQDKIVVTLTDPQGNSTPAQVLSTDPKRLVIVATLGSPGFWKISAHNPNGQESPQLSFPVANTTPFSLPGAIAFLLTAIGVSYLLYRLLKFMLVDVKTSQDKGQWSLGDALSEESAYQPKEIKQKSDIITFASTSRLIALIGLMGILAIVIGFGYSIMWNLYVYGTVPDLSEVRSFLYGSACLFAPYLANQISSAFTPSAKTKGGDAPGVAITGIAPAEPETDPAAQSLHVIGTGFESGLTLTLTDPAATTQTVSGADITAVATSLVSANVTMNLPGAWKISAANSGAAASSPFLFTVFGPPAITAVAPAAPTQNAAAAQPLTFAGTGFISGLKVVLTSPTAGAAPVTVKADTVTSTSVAVQATINAAGQWSAIVTNPHDKASAAFNFTVA